VTVTLMDSQQRTFSILGNGVPRPGRYLIPRYDFRLTDALATAGGPMQFNVSYVYVSRKDETQAAAPATMTTTAAAPAPVSKPAAGPELELVGLRSSEPKGQESLPPVLPPQPFVAPGRNADIPEPKEPAEKFELEREMLDMIAPSARKNNLPASTKVIPTPAPEQKKDEEVMATVMPYGFRLLVPQKTPQDKPRGTLDVVQSPIVLANEPGRPAQAAVPAQKAGESYDWVLRNGQWVPQQVKGVEEARPKPVETSTGTAEQTEWVFRDNQWVEIPKAQTPAAAPPTQPVARVPTLPPQGEPLPARVEPLPPEIEWEQGMQARVLRIPTEKLLAGDPRYNVVLKPGDTVYVPVDMIGEVYIMGNVNRSGVINITGRPMTLKMAIAAAGGLGPLAWPKSVEVIRRIGKEKEEIVMVDLDKIASGEQPDFFIKPHDLINVGTHPSARWRAVLRNAFRAAYGFGFVYDRNFADADFGKGFVLPHWL
jgi:protein involved in polysaccharide export with SLBB domain